jgi:hypothetical protein
MAFILIAAGTALVARSYRGRPLWPYLALIFLLSMTIRVHKLNQVNQAYLVPTDDRELGAIAISLMETGEFADAYIISTGPTAHLPPIPPLLLSVVSKSLGLTSQAGYVMATIIFVAASILYGLLPWLAESLGLGAPAGIIGGLIGALGALSGSIWEKIPGHGEYLTGLFMGLLLVAFLRRWREASTSWKGSLLLGVAAGAAFHIQPALLMVILGCMLFELWWLKERNQRLMVGAIALGILLACLPWGWRNYTTFDSIFFIRSNFGLELRMGHNPVAEATFDEMDAQVQQEAMSYIRSNPAQFFTLTARRIANVWIGPIHRPVENRLGVVALTCLAIVGLWRSLHRITLPQRAALLIPLITFPMVYYVVAYMPRYRIPIDWLLYSLAGAAVWRVMDWVVALRGGE